jgi:hypothetical protein
MSGWRKRTIVEMAREAGFEQAGHNSFQEFTARMEAFAELVRKDEREACAKVCEDHIEWPSLGPKDCADAIRARGQA